MNVYINYQSVAVVLMLIHWLVSNLSLAVCRVTCVCVHAGSWCPSYQLTDCLRSTRCCVSLRRSRQIVWSGSGSTTTACGILTASSTAALLRYISVAEPCSLSLSLSFQSLSLTHISFTPVVYFPSLICYLFFAPSSSLHSTHTSSVHL